MCLVVGARGGHPAVYAGVHREAVWKRRRDACRTAALMRCVACRRVCEPFSWELRRFTALPDDAAPASGAPATPRTPSSRPEAGEEVHAHMP